MGRLILFFFAVKKKQKPRRLKILKGWGNTKDELLQTSKFLMRHYVSIKGSTIVQSVNKSGQYCFMVMRFNRHSIVPRPALRRLFR